MRLAGSVSAIISLPFITPVSARLKVEESFGKTFPMVILEQHFPVPILNLKRKPLFIKVQPGGLMWFSTGCLLNRPLAWDIPLKPKV
jgi:hypothetical protein